MSYADLPYQELLAKLVSLSQNTPRADRTGTGTHSIFGHQMRFDLSQGFPLLTTKKVHFPSVVSELLWFLKGDTNIKYLLEHKNRIWTDWRYKAYCDNWYEDQALRTPMLTQKEFEQKVISNPKFAEQWADIGKGYGHQWRNFGQLSVNWIPVEKESGGFAYRKTRSEVEIVKGFDQISWVINEIKNNPTSRRLIVSGWNPHDVDKVDLPPCHTLFQFFVEPYTLSQRKELAKQVLEEEDWFQGAFKFIRLQSDEMVTNLLNERGIPKGKLSCQLYQRSADVFLGVPFNIASYALLTQIIAKECGLGLGDFVWTGGDVHLYSNHIDQALEQLSNSAYKYDAPTVQIADKGIFDLEPSDIKLVGYESYPTIKAPVAV